MVVAEREVSHQPDPNHVVDHDRALLDIADAENGHLRLIDDRHAELRTELTGIGDREGAAMHLVRLQLLGARAIGDVRDRPGQIRARSSRRRCFTTGTISPFSSATAIPRLTSRL